MNNQLLTNNKVDRDSTKNPDMHMRRVTNAAASVDSNDYVIRQELIDLRTIVQLALKKVGITL